MPLEHIPEQATADSKKIDFSIEPGWQLFRTPSSTPQNAHHFPTVYK